MEQLLWHQISNFQQSNRYFVSVGYKVPLGKKYYLSSKWIKGDVCRRILVLDTSLLSILMTSTPSVPQYMPSICQNIDVSRHVLVYRYIHDRANQMVENTTIRSYRCVCDSQMQRPGVIILLFEKKQTRVWEDECVRAPLLFLYNVLLNSEYKFLWVARWCVREVPRDRFNASKKKTSL